MCVQFSQKQKQYNKQIDRLRREKCELEEEVRQLQAAVVVWTEVARRTVASLAGRGNAPAGCHACTLRGATCVAPESCRVL